MREPACEVVFGARARRLRAAVVALEGSRPGDLRTALAAAHRFDAKALLVAVDGGLATCRAIRRRPDRFVGDLDSTPRAPRGIPSVLFPVDKPFSDFAGALREARRLGARVIVIAGLLGGRLDHEWANLLEVGAAAPSFAGILAPSGRGLVAVTARGFSARIAPGRTVSVFALGAGARISLRGARWTLAKKRLLPGSLGLSNVAAGDLTLAVHDGVAALVCPDPAAR